MVRLAASAEDEAILVRNLTIAFKVSDWFANKNHLNLWDVRDVMMTMLVTESGGGFVYANDGEGYKDPTTVVDRTPWNWNPQTNKPIGTPEQRAQMRAILRKSLDLPHDKVGSNGRSTGPAQQLSAETGGAWGPMAATMRMDLAVLAFLTAVNWADRSPLYLGKQMANWQTAMLLRVQRPLPSEVEINYGAAQLARAQAIARDERFTPGAPTQDDGWILNMADQAALDAYRAQIVNDLKDGDGHSGRDLAERLDHLEGSVAGVASTVNDLHYRVLTPGAAWDNIQDIQAKLAELIGKVDALAANAE